jgi:DnaK suppressor protein
MNSAAHWHEKLLLEQQELASTKEGARDTLSAVEMDQGMSVASERKRRMRISQIDAALKRLETDDFGYCVRCGETIAEERLAADLVITLCLDCAGTRKA